MKSFAKKIDRFNTFLKEENFILGYAGLVGYFGKEEIGKLLSFEAGVDKFVNKMDKILAGSGHLSLFKQAMLYGSFRISGA